MSFEDFCRQHSATSDERHQLVLYLAMLRARWVLEQLFYKAETP